ncbi:GNAT family N-acetyltransferase [Microbacterium sp. LEMMJ01]|uniref:GNAT family N-acetyltransferase n=1 Tax=Microbacterium sp. LEMMJ01 TaxID=1978350 RepID=UPI000A1E74E3|nr:GNAT family N-acetyltransferase [Microbacterium sp. LEMMJ01]OSP08680.1 GNAT family N-acetyltransferase [Microbacterium sp. LEMMJ01]
MALSLTPVPTLTTERLDLVPLGPEHLDGTWAALQEPEVLRLTGTHARFTREGVETWLRSLADRDDRADWAILRRDDGAHIGEVVLSDLDEDNGSAGFRIALAGPRWFGAGYGIEATRAVIRHAFDTVGLHRVELEVYAFNPRAQRAYEKAGFVVEGRRREALRWDGEWVDALVMGVLADG